MDRSPFSRRGTPARCMVFAASLLAAAVGHAQTAARGETGSDSLALRIDRDLRARVAGGFNGALIIEKDGRLLLRAGYGFANRTQRVPFTPRTIAPNGSLTKQFTAAAIVDLAQKGRLRYDDPLSAHDANLPTWAAHITIHQALTHTAGLPEDCGDDFARVTRVDLMTGCLARVEAPISPVFAYSNVGYSMLAAVVESVTGESLEAYLDRRFLAPLGMTRTGTVFPPRLHDEMAIDDTGSVLRPPMSDRIRAIAPAYWNLKGNGGMQSSSDDMYSWFLALRAGTAISPAMRADLTTPHVRRDSVVAYGYGWFIRTGADGTVEQISHTGSDGVSYAAFVWRPQERIFYYLVSNSGEQTGGQAAGRVLRLLRTP